MLKVVVKRNKLTRVERVVSLKRNPVGWHRNWQLLEHSTSGQGVCKRGTYLTRNSWM